MLEGRRDEAWNHTAALLALVAETHRDPQRRDAPFTLHDFHPACLRDPADLTIQDREDLMRAHRTEIDSRRGRA